MTALKDHPRLDPEVLIEEAHRRHRRRRQSLLGAIALIVAVGLVAGLSGGGGGPAAPRPTSQRGGSGAGITAAWHELGAPSDAIPAWAPISSVTTYKGELVAAGTINGPPHLPARLGCGIDCGTVVWESARGVHWRPVLAADFGSTGNVVASRDGGLAVFSAGVGQQGGGPIAHTRFSVAEFERSLRDSGPEWTAYPAHPAEGNVVVSFGDDPTPGSHTPQPLSNSFNQWVRLTGSRLSWRFGYETFSYSSVVRFDRGYVGIGYRGNGVQILWSSNDRLWSKAAITVPNGDVAELSSNGSDAVLELVPDGYPYRARPVQLWYSVNGRQWHRSTVVGRPPVILRTGSGAPTLLSVDGGFITWNRTNDGIWWSTTGRVWKRVPESGRPPADLVPQGFTIEGGSLVLVEQAPRAIEGRPGFSQPGPSTFWRVTLSRR